jgi:hypothetical protein
MHSMHSMHVPLCRFNYLRTSLYADSMQKELTTPEETDLTITPADLTVTDNDNSYPADFTLTVLDGANYTRTVNSITPVINFNGTLTVLVKVNDGTDNSEVFDLQVTVTKTNFDLRDAVLILQVLPGIDTADVCSIQDINGDERIGMAEVIHILRKVAELRN